MEMFIAVQELLYGFGMIMGGSIATQLVSNHSFRFWIGSLFLGSFGLTFTGLWRAIKQDPLCAPLRWLSAIVSIMLWAMLTTHSPTLVLGLVYGTYTIAETRIMAAAWSRPWPRKRNGC